MSHADFVHLHLHTEYSLLDGACRLDRLMERAHELNFSALAITDHGALYGAVDFYKAALEKGIKPIIGCEVYVAPGSRLEKKSGGGRDVYYHLGLLAKDEAGYKNLIKLVTDAHLKGYYYKPRIDKEILAAHKDGIIALSGCLASEVSDLLLKDQVDKARETVDWFRQTLGPENYYLELQNHGIPEQARVNRYLIQWAKEFGLKLVATNDVHYVEKNHSHAHDCLVCIGTQDLLSNPKRMSAGYAPEQFFLRSAEEMKARFAEVPDAVTNTLEVAAQCNLTLKVDGKDLHFPVFSPPEHFTREGYLRKLLADGLLTRYGMHTRAEADKFIVEKVDDPKRLPAFKESTEEAVKLVLDRLDLELKVIEKTGFLSYFLIVGDFVRYGREHGISCVARGSAAGSLVTYLLEIANVDPIRYGLLFERFLNPERVNPPDIDIDFADDRRADVIEYVREKYGRDAVAQIVTFGTLGAKSVVRDVARVMGLSYGDGDRLAKMIPFDLKMTLEKALKQSPELKAAYDSEDVTRELIETALILEDLTRNASVHAAGVVIGDQPLVNLLPLKQDEDGALVTQYAMGPVGDLGLLKMDFLGLKTLTVIRNACEMAKRTQGVDIDIDHLPLDDKKTYDLLNRAETLGVFQLESGGMRDLCRKFQISSVEHITALVALYRPGPMDLIPDFIKRRHGEVKIEYEHPLLETIARETYGILIYQEQVMQAAQILAGFTLGAADILRRAMGKKKVEEMQKQREKFVKGCAEKNKIPANRANQIFDLLEKFAGYGFNKSHAAAYAIVAYQTAYLKANFPVEFYCAMMTNDMADTEKLSKYIDEARQFGIEVLQPDVNESGVYFEPGSSSTGILPVPTGSGTGVPPVSPREGTVAGRTSKRSAALDTDASPAPPKALPFSSFDKKYPAAIHSRNLPHWTQDGATYFVTFRLADSLPKDIWEKWLRERKDQDPVADEPIDQELECQLDKGYGDCWLKDSKVAEVVENALRHFDGERCSLGYYVIMPNHVHVLVRPIMGHPLSEILHSWKSFSAKEANKILQRSGEFWQDESFDHIVRDEHNLEKFSRYILENPEKARLSKEQFKIGAGSAVKPDSSIGILPVPPSSGTGVPPVSPVKTAEAGPTGKMPVLLRPIRFGLAAVKNVGEATVQSILKERDQNGKFNSLSDLCERVETRALNRKTLEALIKCGACDCFGRTRATMFSQIEHALARASGIQADKNKGQSSLFGAFEEKPASNGVAENSLPEWPQHELLAYEKELLGFYVTGHPLTPFAPILTKYALANTAQLAELPNRSMTRIGGLISVVQNGVSKKSGKPYSMVTLEDLEGSVQILCMNENYDKFRALLQPNKAIFVIGEVNTGDERPKLFPVEIMALEDAPGKFTKQVHLRLQAAHLQPAQLDSVRDLVAAHPGKCPLFLCFMQPAGQIYFVETNDRFAVAPSLRFQHDADAQFGEGTYYAKVDTTLPERQSRWPRKPESNGEE